MKEHIQYGQAYHPLTSASSILKDTTPLQRGIIRHLILLVDLSRSITETDLKPSRLHLVLNTVTAFVTQFFSQNPISQLALLITRDGLVQRLTDLSGSPSTHLAALEKLRPKPDPEGIDLISFPNYPFLRLSDDLPPILAYSEPLEIQSRPC